MEFTQKGGLNHFFGGKGGGVHNYVNIMLFSLFIYVSIQVKTISEKQMDLKAPQHPCVTADETRIGPVGGVCVNIGDQVKPPVDHGGLLVRIKIK